jgi:hypothetical protein
VAPGPEDPALGAASSIQTHAAGAGIAIRRMPITRTQIENSRYPIHNEEESYR